MMAGSWFSSPAVQVPIESGCIRRRLACNQVENAQNRPKNTAISASQKTHFSTSVTSISAPPGCTLWFGL